MASRKKRGSGEPGRARRAAGAVGRVLLGVGRAVILPGAAALLYVAAVWCLWQFAARRGARPNMVETDAERCPWLSPRDVAGINSAVQFGSGASMYDRGICRRTAARYAESAWVDRVVAVRRQFPDRVAVDLAVRRPFAYVRRAGRYYLVDRSGCRLPVKPAGRPEQLDCPALLGVDSPAPMPGERWRGRPLADSLRLVEVLEGVLEGRGAGLRLASVEMASASGAFDNRPQLVAQTASGMTIDWGGCNESRTYVCPSLEDKRRELERVLDEVPEPAAIERIMVRYRGGHRFRLRPGWSTASGAGAGR